MYPEKNILNFSNDDIKNRFKNKYYSYSDFKYLAMELGYERASLPVGIDQAEGGFWDKHN